MGTPKDWNYTRTLREELKERRAKLRQEQEEIRARQEELKAAREGRKAERERTRTESMRLTAQHRFLQEKGREQIADAVKLLDSLFSKRGIEEEFAVYLDEFAKDREARKASAKKGQATEGSTELVES